MVTNGKNVLVLSACEAVYTSCEYMMRYLTGLGPENGCVIVDKTGTTLYTDMRYMEAAEKLLKGTEVTPVLYKQADVLERLKGYQSVGVSFNKIAHVEYLMLENAGAKMQNIDEIGRASCRERVWLRV